MNTPAFLNGQARRVDGRHQRNARRCTDPFHPHQRGGWLAAPLRHDTRALDHYSRALLSRDFGLAIAQANHVAAATLSSHATIGHYHTLTCLKSKLEHRSDFTTHHCFLNTELPY